jgi:hypothetical protein
MIATILKSKQATEATFAIIETFSKIRQLSRSIQELSVVKDKTHKNALMQREVSRSDGGGFTLSPSPFTFHRCLLNL